MISELVSVAKLDTAQFAREAKAHADRLRGLKAAQDQVTQADRAATTAAAGLRRELLDLRKVEVAGTGDKKALGKQAAEVRLRLAEQAEATRALKTQSKDLRDEQRRLQSEMKETARVAQQAARAEADAIRMVAKADADRHRERMNFRRQQQAGSRINDLTESVAASDARLMRLRQPLGGIRVAARDAAADFRENWRDRVGSSMGRSARAAPGAVLGAGQAAFGAAAAVGGGLLGAGAGIAARGAQFENLRTSLETVEGSAQKAAASFALIQKFAAQTPYGVEETTQSLIKLKARGLDASLPALTAYGDTAAAMGKTLNDVVEAVADATTGEFERLKEFGIKAKTEGDKVQFTFRGTTETVAKNSADIEQYLVRIGKTNFAGGMERQSKTLTGQLSTLSDTVSQLADTAFQGGLGQALKDIVADLSGAAGGADDLAATIGQVLGNAARDAYKGIKDFVGPLDQLPGKLRAAADWAGSFAKGLGSVVKFGADVVSTLGPANTALIGLGIAATAALGPLGGLAIAGAAIGKAFADSYHWIRGTDQAIREAAANEKFRAEAVARDIAAQEASNAELAANNDLESGRFEAAKSAADRYRAARVRALGKDFKDLTPKQRSDIEVKENEIRRRVRGGDVGGRLEQQGRGTTDEQIKRAETVADESEFARLKAERSRGKLKPSQQKRLSELATRLDVELPTTAKKGPKDKLNAFEAERKQEIDAAVKRAELDAADAALASGNAAGADAAATAAGKATRERLTDQAKRGALPGEVERALLREAGFEDAKNTPPPPVIVYQQEFNTPVSVALEVVVSMSGSSAQGVAGDITQSLKTALERDIIPAVRESFKTSIRR